MTETHLHPNEPFDQKTRVPGRTQLLIQLEYQGRPFHGVTPQPGLNTVASALQNRLRQALGQPAKALTFTARTDKGVCAQVNYATGWIQNAPALPQCGIKIESGRDGLGRLHLVPVSKNIFARSIGLTKTYVYRFRDQQIAPCREDIAFWDIHPTLSIEQMQQAAQQLVGTHDFSAFQVRPEANAQGTHCTIHQASVEQTPVDGGREIVFTIIGSTFLRRMVRIIAGTLAETGCGLMPPMELRTLVEFPNQEWVGPTAPARGLTLSEIKLKPELVTLFDQSGPSSEPIKNCSTTGK